jgi:hypothetical protein
MRSSKIRPLPAKLARNKHLARQPKKTRPARDHLCGIAHEVANQLTIVSLSCFRLRAACARNPTEISSRDLDRIETAIAAIAGLMQSLHEVDDEQKAERSERVRLAPQTSNVYRLFDSAE